MSNTTTTFLTGLTAGIIVGILTAPIEGKKLREILFDSKDGDGWNSRETYGINELISEDSTSFEELKEKIRNDHSS